MDVEQLMLISKALGYDFISEAYLNCPPSKNTARCSILQPR
jgi:hypothetical protein